MVVFTYHSSSQSDSEGSVSSGDTLHAQPAPVKCRWEKCGEWFSQLESLASHVTTQHAVPGKGGLFFCQWESCNRAERGFNARYKMLVHMRTHTNEKPHHCFQCDKSFSRAENLKIHARSHTGERPYACPIPGCGKAYSNSSDRFKHTRTHSVDKPYMCKVEGCSKRYTDPSSLRKHVKTYRHYPGTLVKGTKADVHTETWKINTNKRIPSLSPLMASSGESNMTAFTPMEDCNASSMSEKSCFNQNTILTNSRSLYIDIDSEAVVTRSDITHRPFTFAYDNALTISYPNNCSMKTTQNVEESRQKESSPSYADQVRRSMSPPLYIEEFRGALAYDTNIHQTPLSQQYYLFYGFGDRSTYMQEQEIPLDLSLPH